MSGLHGSNQLVSPSPNANSWIPYQCPRVGLTLRVVLACLQLQGENMQNNVNKNLALHNATFLDEREWWRSSSSNSPP